MTGKKKIPMRQCTGCGEMKEKKSLIRVLKIDDGSIQIDATGKKNGRGAYLCPSSDCLEKAIRTKGLERSLKCPVPQEVYEQLREEMAKLETR